MNSSQPTAASPSARTAWIAEALDDLDSQGLLRRRRAHDGPQGIVLSTNGRPLLTFASNDYLGLAADLRVQEAAREAIARTGVGSGASPLVVGYETHHARLEGNLARFEGAEAAVLFSSGYAANVGTITALVGHGDAVFSDAWNHASLIDGCRLSRASSHVFGHRDYDELHRQLCDAGSFRRRLIVSDGLFSMDGDVADVRRMVELAENHDAMLLIDEAHATGVLGLKGRGVAESQGVASLVDVRVGTLSKALGAQGGFVAGSRSLCDWLVNRSRTYVFSTGLPPCIAAAAEVALEIVEREPWRRAQLAEHCNWLRAALQAQGWNVPTGESPIIPLVVGPARRAIALSAQLEERGLYVPAIRPPSVPPETARLRISLSCSHTRSMLEALAGALGDAAGKSRMGDG